MKRARLLLLVVAAACSSPGPQPVTTVSPPPQVEPDAAPSAPPPLDEPRSITAREPGFTHCCGDEQYRLEIHCASMTVRCYQGGEAGWQRTYGRHCKTVLAESCYLSGCDDKCDGVLPSP